MNATVVAATTPTILTTSSIPSNLWFYILSAGILFLIVGIVIYFIQGDTDPSIEVFIAVGLGILLGIIGIILGLIRFLG